MNSLMGIRSSIKSIFSKYDMFIVPFLKFVAAFVIFLEINLNFGYMELLNNIFIVVIISVICALLPTSATAIVAMIFLVLHCVVLDIVVGAVALCLVLLLSILLLRFASSDALAVVLITPAFVLHVPAAIPLALGAFRKKSAVAASITGVVLYCFLDNLSSISMVVEKGDISKLEIVQSIINGMLSHKELVLSSIIFTTTILVVNIIRKVVTKYTYLISISAGALLYLVLRFIGTAFLEVESDFLWDVVGTILGYIIVIIISFFVHSVDYNNTKLLQFEDDEYYYYVKAIPKQHIEEDDDEDDNDDEEENQSNSNG